MVVETASVAPYNRDFWEAGDTAYFEYHCFESSESSDAALWHRSHEPVTIVRHCGPEDHDPCLRADQPTIIERGEDGSPCLYRVRFAGGAEYDVFEDELLTDPAGYERPNPPST